MFIFISWPFAAGETLFFFFFKHDVRRKTPCLRVSVAVLSIDIIERENLSHYALSVFYLYVTNKGKLFDFSRHVPLFLLFKFYLFLLFYLALTSERAGVMGNFCDRARSWRTSYYVALKPEVVGT